MKAGQFSHQQRNLENKKNDINNFNDEMCKEKKNRFLFQLNVNVLTDEEENCNQKQLHFDTDLTVKSKNNQSHPHSQTTLSPG